MTRRPPRSPPFPYTTLFRSQGRQRHDDRHRREPDGGTDLLDRLAHRPPWLVTRAQPLAVAVEQEHDVVGSDSENDDRKQDRKSTRLNSSHSSISYAVFCLKK